VLTQALQNSLASPIPAQLARELDLPPTSTYADALAARLIRDATNGNIAAIREVYDRTEGKPPKEVVFDDKKNVVFSVVYEKTIAGLSAHLDQLASRVEDEEIKTAATRLKMLLRKVPEGSDAKKWLEQTAGGASAETGTMNLEDKSTGADGADVEVRCTHPLMREWQSLSIRYSLPVAR